ncbi:IS5 family transposase [Catellatospora methionotrophica]|uniref:IS5 family transposase n=2 Tax=Catellatospora methionotrophica TaxID=121620 RepID=UPI0019444496|nr:IS5 family transposase [Catellatospora methionotrophica]
MTSSRRARPYPSDLSDERWALIEPLLTEWRAARGGLGIRPPVHDLREIVNAILYLNRAGVPWEYLPHDFPPAKTVYDYFAKWAKDGTTQKIHDLLRTRVRRAAGRSPQPSAVVLDAQSVKTSSNVAESAQGVDAAKKIKGRKRHVAVDTLGLLLLVLVTAASVHDTAGGRDLVGQLAAGFPTVSKAWVDMGYKKSVVEAGSALGIDVQVVVKDPAVKGFVPNVRWPVERTFGWLMLHRRLVRDYEGSERHSASLIHWAMIGTMSRRLTGEAVPSWRDPAPKTDTTSPI